MKKIWVVLILVAVLILAASLYFGIEKPFKKSSDFSKTSLIRLNIPLNGEINNSIIISNPGKETQTLKVYLNNFKGLASVSSNEMTLESGETRNLVLEFNDKKNVPGVYVGKLIIDGDFAKEEIPIVLGVEDPNHAFAIISSSVPQYDFVYPGGKLGIDLKVFDLINSNAKVVNSHYAIKNYNDEVLLNGNTDLVVGSGSKTELVDIPKDWSTGDYVFTIEVNYKNTTSFASYLFTVSNSDKTSSIDGSKIFFIVVIIFVVLILFFVLYFVKTRDSLIVELKRQQDAELKRNLEYLKQSKNTIVKSKSNSKKKKSEIEKIKKAEKSIVKKLKDKQAKQKREIEKLKKSKTKEGKIKEKMNNWKKQGYKMYEADEEMKKVNNKGIKSQIKDWNKQGYDTSFLNK
jgi:preprotein translocase subunit SecF